MGAGDWLMASGEARKIHKQTGHGVLIVNAVGKIQKSEVFDGVPYILSKPPAGKPYSKLRNAAGLRPYIAGKTVERWTWKPYKPTPAEVEKARRKLDRLTRDGVLAVVVAGDDATATATRWGLK